MDYSVSYRYRPGTKVYYLKNGKPAWGYVKEVEINIDHMDSYGYIEPKIKYHVGWDWYKESELYDDKERFKRMYENMKKKEE